MVWLRTRMTTSWRAVSKQMTNSNIVAKRERHLHTQKKLYTGRFTYLPLEVATPTRRAFSGHGGHALSWRSHGHSVAA